MNKYLRFLVIGIVTLLVSYLIFTVAVFAYYSHKTLHSNFKQYFWLFQDSAKTDIDPFFYLGNKGKNDMLYSYVYKNDYFINIWEFNELSHADIMTIPVHLGINLDNVEFWGSETMDAKEYFSKTVKFGFSFEDSLSISLDHYSELIRKFKTANYQGFYGKINKLALNNAKGEPQIIFDYKSGNEPTICLLYKYKDRFFVIIINANIAFDESIINILNLP